MGNDVKPRKKREQRWDGWAGFSGNIIMPYCFAYSKKDCIAFARRIYGDVSGGFEFRKVRITRER